MKRLQIFLPSPLYASLLEHKHRTGLSLSELVRRAVEIWLQSRPERSGQEKSRAVGP